MGYCDSTDVAALSAQLVAGATDYGTSTRPTKTQVQSFISSGCSLLNALTQGKGYAPPGSTNALWDMYKQMNALYAAWLSERYRTSDQTAPGQKSRADLFWGDFKFHVQLMFGEDVDALDLASAGLAVTNTAGPWAGGIIADEVDDANSDTTYVKPRFARGMSSAFEGTLGPSKTVHTG